MTLSEICIQRPVLTSMLSLALVVFGLVALERLPVRELPDIDPPIVNVTTIYPGANARIVEAELTEKLEEVINGVEGIKEMTSESREQLSSITVEFDLSRDIDLAAQDVRDRVSRVRGDLPDDAEDPIVAKQDSNARPMLWVALFSNRLNPQDLSALADRYMKEALQTVSGVSSIIIGGEKRFAIRIRLDSEKMAAHGVTVLDIERVLRAENVELPSGSVENLSRELTIQTLGELKTPDEFNQLVLRRNGDRTVRLSDVGLAEVGVEDEKAQARYNSETAVGLGIVRQSRANTISVARGVKDEVERLKSGLPEGVEVFIAYDESVFIEDSIVEVWRTLIIAFILVVLTIFVFLRNPRSTFVPVVTIPVSIIASFAVLWIMGYSVNILTMLALVLAIGLVVDDSIVVLENIYRHIEDGMKPFNAAVLGMKEITFAVIATTVSLVAVFLPLAFQTTITGRLFIEFAFALAGAVIISSFIALTLTPMLCARILKKSAKQDPSRRSFFNYTEAIYDKALSWYQKNLNLALNHRRISVAIALFLFLLTGFLYSRLDQEFLPEEDKGRLFNLAIAPEGATAEYTDRMVKKMEAIVKEIPEVGGYFSAVALPFGGPGLANQGLMFIRFKEERDRRLQDIMAGPQGISARFITEVEGALALAIMPKAIGGGFAQPFQLILQHPDLEKLNTVAIDVVKDLQSSGLLSNVRTTFEINKPEIQLEILRERASALNVSVRDIASTLQILFGGQDLSKVKRDGQEFDVIVQLDRENRLTPDHLRSIYVRSSSGELVQLSNLINLQTTAGPRAINRYNRNRSATIEGTPQGMVIGNVVELVEERLEEIVPADFQIAWTGEVEDLKDSQGQRWVVLALAMIFVYMVLAAQFESLVHPFTVMLTIPLGALGALLGLGFLSAVNALGSGMYGWANFSPDPPAIAGILSAIIPRVPAMTINLFSLIGMLLLFGMVTKNSILLVEFANRAVKEGKDGFEAMKQAAAIRFRPILMTSFATIAGILPIAIGSGAGAESRRAMGVAIVAGMGVSTLLTLFLVPVVYTLFQDARDRARKDNTDQTIS